MLSFVSLALACNAFQSGETRGKGENEKFKQSKIIVNRKNGLWCLEEMDYHGNQPFYT